MTKNEDNGKKKTVYYVVDNNGKLEETKEFKPDKNIKKIDLYFDESLNDKEKAPENINVNNAEFKIYKEYKNKTDRTVVYFPINIISNGKTVKYSPNEAEKKIIEEYIQKYKKHWLSNFNIIKYDGEYYVLAELNVNMASPAVFYKYDTKDGTLKEIGELNEVEFLGISK